VNHSSRDAFETDGFVRVRGAIADVEAMRSVLLDAARTLPLMEIGGAMRPGPESAEHLWQIGRAQAFAGLRGDLARAVDGVFGPGVWTPVDAHGGLPQPAFPGCATRWTEPDEAWHVDEPTSAAQPGGWGLLGFALLDRVEHGGGATVILAGSPRRLLELARATGRVVTTEDAVALSRTDLRVVELTGEAGDLVLVDPRCLHTVSANTSSRPRLQIRLTCARASAGTRSASGPSSGGTRA
jgi:hypothetical protein